MRELVGYLRFDTEAELNVLNRIWTLEQNYTNLLLAQQKLTHRASWRFRLRGNEGLGDTLTSRRLVGDEG